MRYFNTEGRCKPELHYMAPLAERLKKIKEQYVDREKYFVINRGRQYGKTTTLMELTRYLKTTNGASGSLQSILTISIRKKAICSALTLTRKRKQA